MSGDTLLCLVSWSASAALLLTLWFRRVARALPTLFAFLTFDLLLGIATRVIQVHAAQRTYLIFWIVTAYIAVAFNCAVLVELGKYLACNGRKPSTPLPTVVGLFGLIFLLLLRLFQWKLSPRPAIWRYTTHALQLTALIELAAFLALMVWSGLARLHWPRRAFAIASGIGFFSVVDFADALAFSHPGVRGPSYRWLAYVPPVTGLAVILYWLQYFLFEDPASAAVSNGESELVTSGRSDDVSHLDRRDSAALLRLFIRSPK